MQINHLIKRDYYTVDPNQSIAACEEKLRVHGFLVVMEGTTFTGILTSDDIVRSGHTLVIDCLHPKPSVQPSATIQTIRQMMKDSGVYVLPVFQDAKFQGVITSDDILAAILDYQGELQQEIQKRRNVEAVMRESEKKHRQLVETLQEGIWLIDKDAITTFVNPHMAEMLGYSVEEMLGKPLFNFMDERGVEIAKRKLERRKRGIAKQHDFEFIRKDGSRIYTIIAITPVTDEKGNYVGALAGVNDITERKLAQEKMLASEKLAVMGRLVADVTHELNNPLTVILSGTQIVLSHLDKKSSPFKKQLESVLRNAKRCKTILGNLLGYNRTIGKKEETVNLPDIIREAIEDVGYQYDMSGIVTVFNCNEMANAEITGNSTALLSVFVNLIRNARQAMGEKGRLTITMQKEDKKHLCIEIHDTGSGINAKQKAELFKPFASGWKERDGSGLGLATSLGIIETHGGSMSAESEGVGKGAMFTILLPCEFKEKKG